MSSPGHPEPTNVPEPNEGPTTPSGVGSANRPDLVVRHNGPNYVVHFPDGGTSTYPDNEHDTSLWHRAHEGEACAAILRYRAINGGNVTR